MIYNTRNRSDDTIESQKEKKASFNVHVGGKLNLTIQCIANKKNLKGPYSWNKMWSLKILVM